MAAPDQIKSLIKSFGEDDDARFFASAMQIAAQEARQGHVNIAQDLKDLIDQAKKKRSSFEPDKTRVVNMSPGKRELGDLLDVVHPRIKLGDMILDPHIHKSIEKLIEEQKKWELLTHHNLQPIRKLLLTGPPGTGKTMTAHAIASELGLAVFVIRLDGMLSRYMGESIAKLRLIFEAMPGNRAVYLFDEFDSIGSHRQQSNEVGEIKRVLNSFLINIEKDNSNSIIIAASNLPDALDNALMRRFDDIVRYPLPTAKEIAYSIKKYTQGHSFDVRPDFSTIAKQVVGLNYSDIAKACEATIKEKILSGSATLHKKYMISVLLSKKK